MDLYMGETLRAHDDLDIAVLRPDAEAIHRFLAGWDLRVVVAPEALEPWTGGLTPSQHAVWCRPSVDAPWAFEVLFNDVSGDTWHFRRDPAVHLPLARIAREADDGTPYLVPEIVLLYKAKQAPPVDEDDFAAVVPRLSEGARRWLRSAIDRVHPGHPWSGRLG